MSNTRYSFAISSERVSRQLGPLAEGLGAQTLLHRLRAARRENPPERGWGSRRLVKRVSTLALRPAPQRINQPQMAETSAAPAGAVHQADLLRVLWMLRIPPWRIYVFPPPT